MLLRLALIGGWAVVVCKGKYFLCACWWRGGGQAASNKTSGYIDLMAVSLLPALYFWAVLAAEFTVD